MKAYETYERINEAYGESTQAYNSFEKVMNSIEWDETFEFDGLVNFIKEIDGMKLHIEAESLNPFSTRKPNVSITGIDNIGKFVMMYGELGLYSKLENMAF